MISTHRGAAQGSWRSRLLASVALGAAVTLGATGCNMIAPQATTIQYSPSEGVSVPASGPLTVRNALLVANEDGSAANLLAAVVNDTDEAATLNVEIGGTTQTVSVPARTAISLGFDGEEPLLFENADALPGTTVAAAVQSGDGSGVEVHLPVLDGALPYFADFVPSQTAGAEPAQN